MDKIVISRAAAAKILVMAGAKRVSAKAAKEFAELIQDSSLETARDAVKFARHSGRRTVLDKDVKLAFKK